MSRIGGVAAPCVCAHPAWPVVPPGAASFNLGAWMAQQPDAFPMTPACPILLGFFTFLCRSSLRSVTLATAEPKRQQIYDGPGEQQSEDALALLSVGNLFLNDLSGIYGSRDSDGGVNCVLSDRPN